MGSSSNKIKGFILNSVMELCINPISQFTINLYLCCIMLYYAVDKRF